MLTYTCTTGDAHRAAADIKKHLPGDHPNAEKNLKGYGREAGAKFDNAVRFFLLFLSLSTSCFYFFPPPASIHHHRCQPVLNLCGNLRLD